MLVLAMLLMGGASLCIGLLPAQATIGQAAPLLLTLLRSVQWGAGGGPGAAPVQILGNLVATVLAEKISTAITVCTNAVPGRGS